MRIGQYALLLAFVINFFQNGYSQQVTATSTAISTQTIPNRGCGTPALPQQFETWVQGLTSAQPGKPKGGPGQTMSVFNIPVIVHVVHNNETLNSTSATTGGNLNAAQIYDQIAILNRDFNALNPDTSNIPTVFKPLLGKFHFNFCLAVVNPTGGVLAEPGIDRINRTTKGWTAPPYTATYVRNTIKPNSIWDPTKYLNMWVLNLGSGLLGFATFPNPGTSSLSGIPSPYGSSTSDGLVMRSNAFGSIGTAVSGSPYHLGRTAVHELGHWLGLRHVWGDATCGTDYCADTPPAQNANYNCPTHPYKLGACTGNSTGEMFMNYMDYTNDACMYMFTNDQKNRAQLIMTHSPMRASLLTSTVCNTPTITNEIGLLYVHSPTYSQVINCNNYITPSVVMHNFGSNTVTSATYSYNVDGSGTQTVSWNGALLPGNSATVTLPVVSNLTNGVHQYNVGVYQPNGQSDPYMTNNYNNQQFSITGSFTMGIAAPSASCAGSAITMTASGTTSYTWNPGAVTGSVATFNPLSPTIYTLSGSNGTCVNTRTVSVSVLPNPTVSVNSPSICSGSSGVLNATGACTYTWLPGNVTGPNLSVSPLLTTQYTLIAEGCNGCGVVLNPAVTVVQTPTVNIQVSPSGSLCAGGSATLTASGAGSYSWNTGATASVIVVSPTSNTTYSVTANTGSCQSAASAIVNVGSSSLNIAVTPNPATVCAGNPITLNATGAGSYSWSTGSNSSSLTVTPNSSTTYTVNGTNGVCSASTVVNVSVVSSPVVAITAQPGTSVCAGAQVQLSATGAASYLWNTGDTSAVALITPSAAGVYSVIGYSQGCPGTATVAIGISGSTLGFTANANPSVLCAGNPATLTANGLSSYTWSGSGTPGDYVVTPGSTTTYTLSGSDGTCSAYATVQVTVVPAPSFTITASSFSVCSGQSATVTATGPYTGYLWQPSSATGTVFVASPGSNTMYTVSAAGGPGGCNSNSVFAIGVTPGPVTILSTTSTACGEPCEGVIQTTVNGGTPPFTFSIPGSSCNALPCNNLCEGLYTLRTTDSAGCSSINYFSIACYIKTGIGKNDVNGDLILRPNPAADNVILSFPGHFSCLITNELGQVVFEKEKCENIVDISLQGFPRGIYLARIKSGDIFLHRKFIKQ